MHPQAAAVRCFLEIQIAGARRYVAAIEEGRRIEAAEQRPPRLGIRHQHVTIMEAVIVVAAKGVVSSESRQKVQRHSVPRWRVCESYPAVHRDYPRVVASHRDELQPLCLVPTKTELALLTVRVARYGRAIQAAGVGMPRIVARVSHDKRLTVEIVGLLLDA